MTFARDEIENIEHARYVGADLVVRYRDGASRTFKNAQADMRPMSAAYYAHLASLYASARLLDPLGEAQVTIGAAEDPDGSKWHARRAAERAEQKRLDLIAKREAEHAAYMAEPFAPFDEGIPELGFVGVGGHGAVIDHALVAAANEADSQWLVKKRRVRALLNRARLNDEGEE